MIHIPIKTATGIKRPLFFPQPLDDEWSKWIVGEWEGAGESNTGQGKAIERVDLALNWQCLIYRGEATITEIAPEHADYLRRNMEASDRYRTIPARGLPVAPTLHD